METLTGSSGNTLSEAYLAEDSRAVLISISVSFSALTTIFIGLRFYSKRFSAAGLGLDDAFLFAAYIVTLGMCALGIVMTFVGGVGRHVQYNQRTNPALLTGWAKCILAFEFIYYVSVALPKIAILLLYLRVFNWKGTMRFLAYALIVMVSLTSLSLVITACFQCQPIAYWWDRTIPGGKCVDVQAFFHAQSIPGFIWDFFIMALPLPTIWGLKLPTAKRVALVLIFLIGSFGVVASIIRAVTFFGTAAFEDRTWASVALIGWSIIEAGTYIITGCLPHMRPLVSHYAPDWLKSMVKKTVTSAGHTMSAYKRSRMDEDEIELTGKSRTSPMSGLGNSRVDVNASQAGSFKRTESLSRGYKSDPERGLTVEVQSEEYRKSRRWQGNASDIMVTTEVKMERA